MDPNSQHQMWTRWTVRIFPGGAKSPGMADVTTNCLRFARKAWGATGKVRITKQWDEEHKFFWVLEAIVEGHPGHDAAYVQYMHTSWEKFFVNGFGTGTTIEMKVKVLAGDLQNGTPREQWIELPSLPIQTGAH